MDVIALRLTDYITHELDSLVKKGVYPNRSEALRDAARLLIRMQKGMFTGRAKPVSKEQILKEFAKEKKFKL